MKQDPQFRFLCGTKIMRPVAILLFLLGFWVCSGFDGCRAAFADDDVTADSDKNLPPDTDVTVQFWTNMMKTSTNLPLTTAANFTGSLVTQPFAQVALSKVMPAYFKAPTATDLANGFTDSMIGTALSLLQYVEISWILETLKPATPFLESAKYGPSSDAFQVVYGKSAELPTQPEKAILVKFNLSASDKYPNNFGNVSYLYRLWKLSSNGSFVMRGQIYIDGQQESQYLDGKGFFAIVHDTYPSVYYLDLAPEVGHNLYAVDTIRYVGAGSKNLTNWSHIGSSSAWFTGLLPSPAATLKIGAKTTSLMSMGFVFTMLDPFVTLANGMQALPSGLSESIAAYVPAGDIAGGSNPADGMAVDAISNKIFTSHPDDGTIHVLDPYQSWSEKAFVNTGFATPHQSGLAIDRAGNLYTDNGASDAAFGGRIFRFNGASQADAGSREFVGTVNYYSQLLAYAKPVAVRGMLVGPDQQLYVADASDTSIKKIDVNATYDASRRVGQYYAQSQIFSFGSIKDMIMQPDTTILLGGGANILKVTPDRDFNLMFDASALSNQAFSNIGSLTHDRLSNLYVADLGSGSDGSITMVSPQWQLYMPKVEPCTLDRYRIMRNMSDFHLIRTDADSRALAIQKSGYTSVVNFGISGQIYGPDKQPLPGALVKVALHGVDVDSTATNTCGTYHTFNVLQSFNSKMFDTVAWVTVTHPDYGTQKFQVYLDPWGQNFRDFVLSPSAPPTPENNDPTPILPDPSDPPAVPHIPIVVTVVPGVPQILPDTPVDIPKPAIVSPDTTTTNTPDDPDWPGAPVPPRISIILPADGMETDTPSQVLFGTVSDSSIIQAIVNINGVETTVPVSDKRYSAQITLSEGYNDITVHAVAAVPNSKPAQTIVGISPPVSVKVGSGLNGTGSIIGRVLDSIQQVPVMGVTVKISGTDLSTATDADGYFRFSKVAAGSATVVFEN